MTTTPNNIYVEFFEIADRGNEQETKDFLLANLKRFPQDAQDVIITAFFEEALKKKVSDERAVSEFQEEGIQVVEKLQRLKEELKKKQRLLDIKEAI